MRFGELFREILELSITPIRLLIEYPLEHLIIALVFIGLIVLVVRQCLRDFGAFIK